MTTAEKIAEEIFRCIERERRILKSDLVEAAERILKMEAPNPNAPQANPVPFVYMSGGNWIASAGASKTLVTTIGGSGGPGPAKQAVTWIGGI